MVTRVMVPLDRSVEAEGAVAAAAMIARANRAELHLVLVQPGRTAVTVPEPEVFGEYQQYLNGAMRTLATELANSPGLPVTTAVCNGDAAIALAGYAATNRIDLIVMTTHGRTGWSRAWTGSVADELMHRTVAPVLMLRHDKVGEVPRMQRVLVAVEQRDQAREAALMALDLFDGRYTVVTLAQVVSPVPMNLDGHFPSALVLTDAAATQELVAETKDDLDELAGVLRCGAAAMIETLVELAAPAFPSAPIAGMVADLANRTQADVVALTTHERGWTRLLTGSVADHVLDETPCMLLVRHGVVPAEASISYAITSVAGEVMA